MGCISLSETDCPFEIIKEENARAMRVWGKPNPDQVVFVDEAQFLTRSQVLGLTRIADELSTPVFAFGLRTDFKGEPFEGSIYLMGWADQIEEISTFGKMHPSTTQVERAKFNMKVDELGKQITSGESVSPGFGYIPVSRRVFGLPLIK
jgi:thymidine kinase